ncbi:MAG: hypothetical protein WDZ49_04625, partial [Litorilinea sp.]
MSQLKGLNRSTIMVVSPQPESTASSPARPFQEFMAKMPAAHIQVCPDGAAALEWFASSEHAADIVFYDLAPDWERGGRASAAGENLRMEATPSPDLPVETRQIGALTQFIRGLRTLPEQHNLPVIVVGPGPATPDFPEQSDAPVSAGSGADPDRLYRALFFAGAIEYVSYSVESKSLMHTIETAPMR